MVITMINLTACVVTVLIAAVLIGQHFWSKRTPHVEYYRASVHDDNMRKIRKVFFIVRTHSGSAAAREESLGEIRIA